MYIVHMYDFNNALFLGYNILLARSEVIEKEEHYIYDFISFISECGGSLGLFLGFSFFMVLDYLAPFLVIVKKLINWAKINFETAT